MVWMGQGGKAASWRGPWGGDGCGGDHITETKYLKDLQCEGDAEPPKTTASMVAKSCVRMPFIGPDSAHTILRL